MKDFTNINDILDFAIGEEEAAVNFYTQLASQTRNDEIRAVFTSFAREEMVHVMKFYRYVFERGGCVALKAIPAPPKAWKSILDAFRAAYAHEQMITGRIHKLMDQAAKEKDFATQGLLQWFVTEQVEEEASALEWVNKLEMVGDSKPGLYMMDREAAARAFKG